MILLLGFVKFHFLLIIVENISHNYFPLPDN